MQKELGLTNLNQATQSLAQRAMPKRELYLWLYAAIIIVLAAKVFRFGSFALFYHAAHNINLFMWGAVAVAAWRLNRFTENQLTQSRDVALMSGLGLGCLFAVAVAGTAGFGPAFGVFGLALIFARPNEENLRSAGIVMLALATHFTIAPLFFRAFLDQILTLDSAIVAFAFQILRPDMVWKTATQIVSSGPGHFGILLVGGCSAFNGISAAFLVHLAWAMKHRTYLTRYDTIAVCATAILIIILNTGRLLLTGWDRGSYDFWHGADGDTFGALMFSLAQTGIIVGGGYFSARWAAAKEV